MANIQTPMSRMFEKLLNKLYGGFELHCLRFRHLWLKVGLKVSHNPYQEQQEHPNSNEVP